MHGPVLGHRRFVVGHGARGFLDGPGPEFNSCKPVARHHGRARDRCRLIAGLEFVVHSLLFRERAQEC